MCNESRIYEVFFLNDITENNELFHNILIHRDGAVYIESKGERENRFTNTLPCPCGKVLLCFLAGELMLTHKT